MKKLRDLGEAICRYASRVQILHAHNAPLSTPGLVVVGIYAFIGAYAQQFLFAITFNSKKEFMPIPAGLYEFIGYQTIKWNEMMAASLVGIAPVLIIFIFLQRYIVEGLTAGAVKNLNGQIHVTRKDIFIFWYFNFFNIYPSSFCRDVLCVLETFRSSLQITISILF